ncbi:L-lactate permease [Prevotella sp. KH2C16]|uniref:L-lactate permease n=1 Tax=Prevotella sp. KH2C16 TaxID=1855325 RepID=UPI0008E08F74|nr:L-lactate permease [Prevotella sp. KH2C16]SFG21825.1 lactate permease [Prevotella sp. KH2C16]
MPALVSIIPILLLFALMLGFKMPGYKSALITLIVTILLALFAAPALGMLPAPLQGVSIAGITWWAVVEGVLKAVFPILIVILMAIYSYNILVEDQQIETIKKQFTSISEDRGIIVLILVWGFGGLLEGMAGFGTAVAIPAAILIGLGFKPMFSALVALLANSVPVAFGAVGIPVTTLCNEISPGGAAPADMICEIAGLTVVQLSPLFFLIPFVILMLTERKALVKNITLTLWTGCVSLVVQYACAHFLGAETPAILGSIAAIAAIVVYAKVFIRKKAAAATPDGQTIEVEVSGSTRFTFAETFKAWSVYIFILAFILISGALCPSVNGFLKSHLVTAVDLPVIGSTFKFGWISNAGLMLFLGATVGGLIQGVSFRKLMLILARTLVNLRYTVITIVCLIAMSSVMNYSGMISAIAVSLVALTGSLYPLFAPLIGGIGTFVTGSDTSSNILFAKLQANVAGQLGLTHPSSFFGFSGNETNWLAAGNTTGATGGKIISPQSIAIATASCNMQGQDGEIIKKALPYAIAYIIISGLMVYFGL